MKKLFVFLLALCCASYLNAQARLTVLGTTGAVPPALVSHALVNLGASGGTTGNINMAGINLALVAVIQNASASTCTFSSSPSVSWNSQTRASSGNQPGVLFFWAYTTSLTSTTTFTCTGSSAYITLLIMGFSGTFVGTMEGQNDSTWSSSSGPQSTGSTGTLTGAPNEVCPSFAGLGATVTSFSVGTMTLLDSAPTNTNSYPAADAYLIPSSDTALNPSWSWSTATTSGQLQVACFK